LSNFVNKLLKTDSRDRPIWQFWGRYRYFQRI